MHEEFTRRSLRAVSGADTTPQVFIGGRRIGGADDLATYLSTQEVDRDGSADHASESAGFAN